MGMFIIRYDTAEELAKAARHLKVIPYLSRSEPFQKLWMARDENGTVTVHEFLGKTDEIQVACYNYELQPVFADYEYIK